MSFSSCTGFLRGERGWERVGDWGMGLFGRGDDGCVERRERGEGFGQGVEFGADLRDGFPTLWKGVIVIVAAERGNHLGVDDQGDLGGGNRRVGIVDERADDPVGGGIGWARWSSRR